MVQKEIYPNKLNFFIPKLMDTTFNSTRVINYENGLVKKNNLKSKCYNYLINNKNVFVGTYDGFWHIAALFDDSFLTISKIKQTEFGPAGPEEFLRKQLYIIDFKEQKLYETIFTDTILIRLGTSMRYHDADSEEEYSNSKYIKSYSIDSIDVNKKELILFNEMHKLEKYKMKELDIESFLSKNSCNGSEFKKVE